MENSKNRVNLLEGNITSALMRLAFPIMGSSFIQMAYTLIDTLWVGYIGSAAVTAVSTAGLFTWIGQALVIVAKVGGQITIGQSLGANNKEKAGKFIVAAIQLTLTAACIYAAFLLIANEPLIAFYNLKSTEIVSNTENYIKIAAVGMPAMFFNYVMTGMVTATGNSKTLFRFNTAGITINMILDPLLIFGIGVFPVMEVEGAALATVISQYMVSMLYIIFMRRDTYIFGSINIFQKAESVYVQKIVKLGLPPAMQTMGFALITMVLSRMVAVYGDTAIGVQRVGAQIESITWMTANGFSDAINAFIAQNRGADNIKRVKDGYKKAMGIITSWGLFTTAVLFFGAEFIFSIFIHEPVMIEEGEMYLKIIALSQLFMCFEIISTGSFAGMGVTKIPSAFSLAVTASRIPLALLLSAMLMSINGVWWAMSLTSIVKGTIMPILFIIYFRKLQRERIDINI